MTLATRGTHVENEEDKFVEIWEKMGAEFKSKFLMMLRVTPYCILFCAAARL